MNTTPLVSVIIPTHNRASLLPAAIESVLSQTYGNLELIVVDDASTDATAEVVRQHADSRLRYVRLPRSTGAAVARNAGLAQATGRLIAFNDDDDVWLLQKLERQVPHLLEAPDDVVMSLSGYVRYWPHGAADYVGGERYARAALDFNRGLIGEFSLLATPAWLVRREVLDRTKGFEERLQSWEDWELAYRLAKLGKIIHLDAPLFVQNRMRPLGQGMWANGARLANAYQISVEKHGADWSARDRSMHYYWVARVRLELEGPLAPDAVSMLERAVQEDPSNFKARSLRAAVAAGPVATRLALGGVGALKRAVKRA